MSKTPKIKLSSGEVILRFRDNLSEDGVACGEEDFTFYIDPEKVVEALTYVWAGNACRLPIERESAGLLLPEDAFRAGEKQSFNEGTSDEALKYLKPSLDAAVKIICHDSVNNKVFVLHGRANVAMCYGGTKFSVTVRRKSLNYDNDTEAEISNEAEKDAYGKALLNRAVSKSVNALSKFDPKSKPCGHKMGEATYLYDLGAVCGVLGSQIFDGDKIKRTGLIVISGSTGGGKSQVALGLMWQYLNGIPKEDWKRRAHVVVVEEPIEKKLFYPDVEHAKNRERGFDFTQRNLKLDVVSLRQALRDAKRMMPAVVFIGETREASDWREVVDFAGSGHLVITTTHAGSLVETIQRIFKAINVGTPAERGNVAKSILAAVHLDSLVVTDGVKDAVTGRSNSHNACVPAVWLHGGETSLVSDGLASLVPNNPLIGDKHKKANCLGRYWIAKQIKDLVGGRSEDVKLNEKEKEIQRAHFRATAAFWKDLEDQTIASDLRSI